MDEDELVDSTVEPEEPVQQAEEEPETDEYGNPPGTEYDDDGYPIPELEDPVVVDPVVTPTPRTPASLSVPTGYSADEREYLETIFTPQQWQAIEGNAARAFAAGQASMAVASEGVEAILADASPDYRRMVTPKIQTVFSRMTPAQRADPHAADDALLVVMGEEARQTGESIIVVMNRHLVMKGGVAPARNKPVIPPKNPAFRAPSPSNAGRGPVVRSANRNASSDIKLVAAAMGISVDEAQRMGLK